MEITDSDLEDLRTMVRFPSKTTIGLKHGDLLENVKKDRSADVNIINIEADMTIEKMISIVNESHISAIFCADSEYEMFWCRGRA